MNEEQNRERRDYTEEFTVSGDAVVAKVKELIHEGNIRRLTIKNEEGRTLIEVPLTLGVIGSLLLPVWAAIGAIAALAAKLTIGVERVGEPAGQQNRPGPGPGAQDEQDKRLDPHA